jgi:hypothetical protein
MLGEDDTIFGFLPLELHHNPGRPLVVADQSAQPLASTPEWQGWLSIRLKISSREVHEKWTSINGKQFFVGMKSNVITGIERDGGI